MLTGKTINGKEYEHCPQVSNEFEMKTMKDYHNLYLQCGVLLLAGVFEKFRNNSLKHYGLFQSHYLRVAALIWDTIPNTKKVELEPISDLDMYILLEKCMRGGDSYISNRYSKTNDKFIICCDPKRIKTYHLH